MYFLTHFLAPKGQTEKTQDGMDNILSLFATFVCVYIYIYIYNIWLKNHENLFFGWKENNFIQKLNIKIRHG